MSICENFVPCIDYEYQSTSFPMEEEEDVYYPVNSGKSHDVNLVI